MPGPIAQTKLAAAQGRLSRQNTSAVSESFLEFFETGAPGSQDIGSSRSRNFSAYLGSVDNLGMRKNCSEPCLRIKNLFRIRDTAQRLIRNG